MLYPIELHPQNLFTYCGSLAIHQLWLNHIKAIGLVRLDCEDKDRLRRPINCYSMLVFDLVAIKMNNVALNL